MGILSRLRVGQYKQLVVSMSLATVVLVMLLQLVVSNFVPSESNAQHFTDLARSFLRGQTYFSKPPLPLGHDVAIFNGHVYWPLGPFPAVMSAPFVYLADLFNVTFREGYLEFVVVLIILYLTYRLAKLTGYQTHDALFLAGTLFSSTLFFYTWAPISSYLSHTVVVAIWLAALVEYVGNRRYWLIGLLVGCALATRVPAGLGIAFFCLILIFDKSLLARLRAFKLIELLIPYFTILASIAVYNYCRFGNLFEQGYSYQIVDSAMKQARDYGLFGLVHLPGNLYYLFLAAPIPVFRDGISHVLAFPFISFDPWGLSIFVTAPYLGYLFFVKYNDLESRSLLVSTALILLPILLYYGIGHWQFGYRYAFDAMPLVFWLLLRQYRAQHDHLSFKFKMIVLTSACLNFYLAATYQLVYK